ncbi:MAG TPA: PIG-L family deacetylase, partial [Bacteroidia bacterium]|nr:PIG-L family deacetylase [Bacteroidia bacterium]
MHKVLKTLLVAAFFATGIFFASAQKAPEKNWNSARIVHELKKMKHVGRVLYVAAHPDDENTQLISYLANDLGLETAYLSLTRGDGGQDLLGPEVREELGVIRTQELLMARSVDGGQQFFSRANDFGFSKTAAETFHIWDSTQVLSDMVWVIRKFKPDLIITRFSPTYAKTHGHHQASAMLAMVAFNAAADPTKFPEQLKYVDTWQAEGLYWNTSTFFFQDNKFDTAGLYHTNIGTYLPLLGKSVGELAAESRTMHKSQGMGTTPRRGDIAEYFVSLEGKKSTTKDIFQSINSDWSRIKGCEGISSEIDKLIEHFDMNMQSPEQSVSWLIDLDKKLQAFKSNYLVASKIQQIEDLILQCDGMYTEALSTKEFLPVSDSINLSLNILHQSSGYNASVTTSLMIDGRKITTITKDSTIPENIYKVFKASSVIPDSTHITGPYWLENTPSVGMYNVPSQLLRGLPQNPKQLTVHISYELRGTGLCNACPTITIEKDVPVFYKTIDPIKGEQYALARIVPPAVANPQSKLLVFNSTEPKDLIVNLKSFRNGKAHIL